MQDTACGCILWKSGTDWTMRIFIVAAVILTVFAIIATAAHDGLCLGVTWNSWACAALLAFFVDLLIGGWVGNAIGGPFVVRRNPPVA